MELGYWILNGKHNLVKAGLMEWASFFEDINHRRVAETWRGRVWVSTVFLVIDHKFASTGAPILFETMIFHTRRLDGWQERYHTWEEAEAGHQAALRQVRFTDVLEAELAYYWNLIPVLPAADKTWLDTLKWCFALSV